MTVSVIVTVVDGGATLTRCLEALAAQQHALNIEVIVPFDATIDVEPHQRRFAEHRVPVGLTTSLDSTSNMTTRPPSAAPSNARARRPWDTQSTFATLGVMACRGRKVLTPWIS